MHMEYEWDSCKNQVNIEDRAIPFELVNELDWDSVIQAQDKRIEHELRIRAYGLIGGRLFCLVYTMRGQACRVISLRKANRREVRDYEQA